jgi:hypothetical protein
MWVYYVALFLIVTMLAGPIVWIYKVILNRLGQDIALLALTGTIVGVLAFIVRGAVHASRIEGFLRGQVMTLQHPPRPGTTINPFEFKLFGRLLFSYPEKSFEFRVQEQVGQNEHYKLLSETPRPSRIRRSRFPEKQIRTAVFKWENRGNSLSTLTLCEFLEQEFGSSNGVLGMAPTTFYGHRTRILNENNGKE